MIDLWLTAIEDLILDAPGNDDADAGPLWDSTLDRLGETAKETARDGRFFWDYLEASDVAPYRPFFVLTETDLDWDRYNLNDLAAIGTVEVAYTEKTLETAADHKTAKAYFAAWSTALIQSCAERARSADVPIVGIHQTVFPQRTPRKDRNPDDPETDYFWAAWQFVIGNTDRYR
jgi:hypothetical protein